MEEIKLNESKQKENSAIIFMSKLLKICQENNIKISVIGGYGLDGLLGRLTHKHNDLDLIVLEKDINKLNHLIQEKFDFIELKFSNKRIHILKSINIKVEIIVFELFSINEKYVFTMNEIFPNELYGNIQSLQFSTPSVEVHRKIGNMYIDNFSSIGKELDFDKVQRRERILCQVEKTNC